MRRRQTFLEETGIPDPAPKPPGRPPVEELTIFCPNCELDLWKVDHGLGGKSGMGPSDLHFLLEGDRHRELVQTNCPACGDDVFVMTYNGGYAFKTRERGDIPREHGQPGVVLRSTGRFPLRTAGFKLVSAGSDGRPAGAGGGPRSA